VTTETVSGVTSTRLDLQAALEAAGVRTVFRGQAFATPCAIISPDDPWLAPSDLGGGRRAIRWRVWAVSGVADANGNYTDVEALMAAIVAALDPLPGWTLVTFSAPLMADIAGSTYTAARGLIETIGGT
jgi:hypothetical protein